MAAGGGSGLGQAAAQLMKEMRQAQQQPAGGRPGGSPNGGKNFQEALNSTQAQAASQTQAVNPAQRAQKAARILATAKVEKSVSVTRVGSAERAENSKMVNMIQDLVNGQSKMTNIMNMAMSGRQFSAPELLAMQAGVYRFAQELELTSKVIEKATSGIKQTMNTQV